MSEKYTDSYVVDSDENSDFIVDTIEKITQVGPRAPCSYLEKEAGKVGANILEEYCDEIHFETFETYPRAFL